MTGPVKYLWPENELMALVAQPGGKTREQAVAGARECLETIRDLAVTGIDDAVASIERVLQEAGPRSLGPGDIQDILKYADRMAAIALAFDLPILAQVAECMGEVGAALLECDVRSPAPMEVHVRAARWAADHIADGDGGAQEIISGLRKVVARFSPDSVRFQNASVFDTPTTH